MEIEGLLFGSIFRTQCHEFYDFKTDVKVCYRNVFFTKWRFLYNTTY